MEQTLLFKFQILCKWHLECVFKLTVLHSSRGHPSLKYLLTSLVSARSPSHVWSGAPPVGSCSPAPKRRRWSCGPPQTPPLALVAAGAACRALDTRQQWMELHGVACLAAAPNPSACLLCRFPRTGRIRADHFFYILRNVFFYCCSLSFIFLCFLCIFTAAARTASFQSGLFLRMSPTTQNPRPLTQRVGGRMMPKLN